MGNVQTHYCKVSYNHILFKWVQFMNNPESSGSCHPFQVSVQTPAEKNKFVFSRNLQMTYRHITQKKKKKEKVLCLGCDL